MATALRVLLHFVLGVVTGGVWWIILALAYLTKPKSQH